MIKPQNVKLVKLLWLNFYIMTSARDVISYQHQQQTVVWRGGSMLGQGAISPQTSAFPPNVTQNTVWRTQSISIEVQKVVFCGLQNTPKCVSGQGSPDPTRRAHDALPASWLAGERTPLPILHPTSILPPSAPRFPGHTGAVPPQIFSLVKWVTPTSTACAEFSVFISAQTVTTRHYDY